MEISEATVQVQSATPDENFHPVEHPSSPTNYHNFGRCGGIHHEINNPSRLNRNRYPYPQHVSRVSMGTTCLNYHKSPAMMDGHLIPRQEGSDDKIEEDDNDYPMTTPDVSRNPSLAEHEDRHEMPAAIFGVPSIIRSQYPPSKQSSIPYVPINTYESFVPFSELRAPNNGNSSFPSPLYCTRQR